MEKYGNFGYNITFLIERWGIKRQSVQWYIDRYKDEINATEVHIKKIGKEWRLDAKAVSFLDEMAGFVGDKVAVFEYESAELTRIKELEQALAEVEAENARQKEWLDSQALVAKKQLDLLEAKETKIKELEPKVLQLNAAEADNKLKADQIAELQADGVRKDQAISNLQAEKEEQKAEIKKLEEDKAKAEATVATFKNMKFLDRLKFLFGS